MKKIITALLMSLAIVAVTVSSTPTAEAQAVCPGCCSVQGLRVCLVPGGILCGQACGCVGVPGVGYGC